MPEQPADVVSPPKPVPENSEEKCETKENLQIQERADSHDKTIQQSTNSTENAEEKDSNPPPRPNAIDDDSTPRKSEKPRSLSAFVKDNKDSELTDRERSKSSPKTLRELSKEIRKTEAESSDVTQNGSATEDIDEGVDMRGIFSCFWNLTFKALSERMANCFRGCK